MHLIGPQFKRQTKSVDADRRRCAPWAQAKACGYKAGHACIRGVLSRGSELNDPKFIPGIQKLAIVPCQFLGDGHHLILGEADVQANVLQRAKEPIEMITESEGA